MVGQIISSDFPVIFESLIKKKKKKKVSPLNACPKHTITKMFSI